MTFPAFFAQAPRLRLHDPLAELLGSSDGGILDYGYEDAVRLAGHSCAAVAGAWLMVRAGLDYLYDEDLPARGGIEVYLRDSRDQGTTGVIAAIAGLLTGAAAETGFGGIGPRHQFARRDLLVFDADIDGCIGLCRRDNGRGVVVDIDTDCVPHAPEMKTLMPRVLSGPASLEERRRFAELWQDRVRRMLLEHADDPKLIHVYHWQPATGG